LGVSAGAKSLALSPASVVVTAVALDITAIPTITLALSPASVEVTAQAVAVTVGSVSLALSPSAIMVAGQALGLTAGATSAALSPASITVTADTLGLTPGGSSVTITPATVAVTAVALDLEATGPLEPDPNPYQISYALAAYSSHAVSTLSTHSPDATTRELVTASSGRNLEGRDSYQKRAP
jgi:hypothetical protein